jgi:uncharacterized protein (DUF58 family)
VRLRIVACAVALALMLAMAGGDAFALALKRSVSPGDPAGGSADPLKALAHAPGGRVAAGSAADGSFQLSAKPGRWVSEFLPRAAGDQADPLAVAGASRLATVRYMSSASLVPEGAGASGAADGLVMNGLGLAFIDAATASPYPEGIRPPNANAMLLAGLALIGLMARQRISGT